MTNGRSRNRVPARHRGRLPIPKDPQNPLVGIDTEHLVDLGMLLAGPSRAFACTTPLLLELGRWGNIPPLWLIAQPVTSILQATGQADEETRLEPSAN